MNWNFSFSTTIAESQSQYPNRLVSVVTEGKQFATRTMDLLTPGDPVLEQKSQNVQMKRMANGRSQASFSPMELATVIYGR